jgi:hypothetical protein
VATADAHAAILAEQAVSNLLTPAWHVGLSDRMEEYEPWGSGLLRHPRRFHTVGTTATDDAAGTDDHSGHDHGDSDHDDHDGHDHGEGDHGDGDKDESDGATGWTVFAGAVAAALAVVAF